MLGNGFQSDKLTNYTLSDIYNFIQNKSIAIVGNASSIFDSSFGSEIDNHDIVIRFNKGILKDKISQGSKTTIWIVASTDFLSLSSKFTPRFIILRFITPNFLYTYPSINNTDKRVIEIKNSILNGKNPSTGFLAIDMCRFHKPKLPIDIYGFDGNKTKTFYNPESYVSRHNMNDELLFLKQLEKDNILKIH